MILLKKNMTEISLSNSNDEFIKLLYEQMHQSEKDKYNGISGYLKQYEVNNKEIKREIMSMLYDISDNSQDVDDFVSIAHKNEMIINDYDLKLIYEHIHIKNGVKFKGMNDLFKNYGVTNRAIRYTVISDPFDVYDNHTNLEEFVNASRSLVTNVIPKKKSSSKPTESRTGTCSIIIQYDVRLNYLFILSFINIMKEIIEHLEIMDLVRKVINQYNSNKFGGLPYVISSVELENPPWAQNNTFDVDRYLPQNLNDDWFEIQPESISLRNRHLINVTRPIGINTIGQRLGGNYNLRTEPATPTHIVSPWLQSSISLDLNRAHLI